MSIKYNRVIKADDTGEEFFFPAKEEQPVILISFQVFSIDNRGDQRSLGVSPQQLHISRELALKTGLIHNKRGDPPLPQPPLPQQEITDVIVGLLQDLGVAFEE